VKTAPHFGHLIFASFVTPAHPNENTAKSANAKKILTHFLITLHLLSSMIHKTPWEFGTSYVEKTDNKNPLPCQEKNKPPLETRLHDYFFFLVAFLVVFLALGCFMPHAMSDLPPLESTLALFIPLNSIFVKTFLL